MTPETELLPLGQDAVLVRFSIAAAANVTGAVQAFRAEILGAGIPGITEVAGSLNAVLVRFDPKITSRRDVERALRESLGRRDWRQTRVPDPLRRWTVPLALSPRLAEAAALAGVSETQAAAQITGSEVRVLAIGFAPGQPYLGSLPKNWDLPRQSSLTPLVPAGTLAVAVRQLVLFANDSKTGWHEVGLTGFRPFKADRTEPFLLRQGDAVRFVSVSESEMRGLLANSPDGLAGARCEVLG